MSPIVPLLYPSQAGQPQSTLLRMVADSSAVDPSSPTLLLVTYFAMKFVQYAPYPCVSVGVLTPLRTYSWVASPTSWFGGYQPLLSSAYIWNALPISRSCAAHLAAP